MPYYLRKYKDMEETASDFGSRLLYQRVTLISSASSSSSSNSDSLSSSPSPSPSPLPPLSCHHGQDSPPSPKHSMVQLSFDDEDELCFSTSNLGYNSSSCGYVRDEDETIVNVDSAADKSNSPNLTFTNQEILPTPTSRLVSAQRQMTSSVKSSQGRYTTRRPPVAAVPSFLHFDDSSDEEDEDDEEGSSSSSTHRASDDCVSSESDSMDHHHNHHKVSTNP